MYIVSTDVEPIVKEIIEVEFKQALTNILKKVEIEVNIPPDRLVKIFKFKIKESHV